MNNKLKKLADALVEKKTKEDGIKTKYGELDKAKKLTIEQRVKRLEELLNL